jgi:hypothetical protein
MNILETNLKTLCLQSPHWMQIELQAFWYGLLSYTMDAAESKQPLDPKELSPEILLQHADPEFQGWPTDWLQPFVTEFTGLTLNFQQQQEFFEHLETLFQDTVPVDLNIFTVLAEGELLTQEQWKRLLDTLAFQPPSAPLPKQKNNGKTKRVQGRRGITPLKRRRAYTAHKKHSGSIICLKIEK